MTGWGWLQRGAIEEEEQFRKALEAPAAAQRRLLERILSGAADTVFGREHGLAGMGPEDFVRHVPVRDYEGLRPYIDRCADGEPGVLTQEPVLAFEETGGTASGGKLVPMTAGSLAAFRAAVLPWLSDLLRRHPAIMRGRAYSAVGPAGRPPRRTRSGIPVGPCSDAEYLGADAGPALAAISAVPAEVGRIADLRAWAVMTAAHLVAAPDLSFVSVWSPTFLAAILDVIETEPERVCAALDEGGPGLPASPLRRRALLEALGSGRPPASLLWPKIAVVSAWADGPSQGYAKALAARVPQAFLQPKGLLATEGAITVPFGGARLPALTATFLEFMDGAGATALADALRPGETYRVLLTTPGGLYRYDIGDQVLCMGLPGGVPDLGFVGRAGCACDLVGEKLTEAFVSACLADLAGFAVLVPARRRAGYLLVTDRGLPDEAEPIERALRRNPQYAYAVDIGQLAPLRAVRAQDGMAAYVRWAMSRGRRLSDIKPPRLFPDAAGAEEVWPGLRESPIVPRDGAPSSFRSGFSGAPA
jgi:hypothetical protein